MKKKLNKVTKEILKVLKKHNYILLDYKINTERRVNGRNVVTFTIFDNKMPK